MHLVYAQPKSAPHRNGSQPEVGLIGRLLTALDIEGVSYCHWKSNYQIDRWLDGEGDLDLLISSRDVCKFTAAISRLGFKKVIPPAAKDLPGVLNFYGYDPDNEKFIHIHAHYRLVLGHDTTKNYRIPIEVDFIASRVRPGAIPIASPELEFVLFVIRMVLKSSATESIGRALMGRWSRHFKAIERELRHLESKADQAEVDRILTQLFPMIDRNLFLHCLSSLRADGGMGRQMSARYNLERSLAAYARRTKTQNALLKMRRQVIAIANKILRLRQMKRFESGGALIAIVGGDGAGKSTCVKETSRWLGKKFATKSFHLGKPERSVTTLAAAGALKLAGIVMSKKSEMLTNLRSLSIARDRYSLYCKARRLAAAGWIVVCDRFPLPQLQSMDAPKISISTAFGRRLADREKWYYRQMLPPDVLLVLRVRPEVAVERKTDEPAEHVRKRSFELWKIDWRSTNAQVVDSGRDLNSVLTDIKRLIWQTL